MATLPVGAGSRRMNPVYCGILSAAWRRRRSGHDYGRKGAAMSRASA